MPSVTTPKRNIAALFDSNPPRDRYIRELFWDREKDLAIGLEFLQSGLQTTGESFGRMLAVHGVTQSGKSHFVHRLLEDVREQIPSRVFKINANTRGSARAILEEVYFSFWADLKGLRDQVPEEQHHLYDDFEIDLDRVTVLVKKEVSEITLEETHDSTTKAEGGAGLKPTLFLSATLENRAGAGEKRTLRTPTDRDLVEYLRWLVDAFITFLPGKKIVVFIDDLDLLDRRGREGQEECNLLVDLLTPLAEHGEIVMIVTSRQAYFNGRDKSFIDFVGLRPMDDTDVGAVYRRRIETFNGGQEVFSAEALDLMVRVSEGKVGIFLNHCANVFKEYYPPQGTLLGVDQVREHVRKEWDALLRGGEHTSFLLAIEAAVRAQQSEVTIAEGIRDTALEYKVLTPVTARTNNVYSINPLYAEMILASAKP